MQRKTLGRLGEEIASRYLQKRGYRILDKNFSCKLGEIDLVALEEGDLVFVEVKARRGEDMGRPEESVTKDKLGHIKRAGICYKKLHPELPDGLRVDVVAITLDRGGEVSRLKLFRNAS